MKKNVMMRMASCLLVAVLLTTCIISGTFAKYTTEATGSDSARVAKWGFTETTIVIDMFDDTYTTSVDSNNGDNVVAPGTTKTATIAFIPAAQDAPEVAYNYNISIETTEDTDTDLLAKLTWKLDNGTAGTFAELQTAVAALSQTNVAANSFPTNFAAGATHTITWEWAFFTDTATDTSDTAKGNATSLAELGIKITVVATQVD